MTDNALIVLAPWLIFAAALAVICVRLRWPRRPSRSSSPTPAAPAQESPPEGGSDAGEPRSSGQVAGGGRYGARS
jgi:hypothetical protein